MDGQQIIALAIVLGAAAWLGRKFVVAARNFFSSQGHCSGCDNCAASAAERKNGKTARQNVIALSDIQTLPSRTPIDEFLKR